MSAVAPNSLPITTANVDRVAAFRGRSLYSRAPAAQPVSARPPHRARSSSGGAGTAGRGAGIPRAIVPPLTVLALEALLQAFPKRPVLQGLPEAWQEEFARRLPTDLDVRLTATSVPFESYWRRVVEAKGWIRMELPGGSWKRAFLEKYVSTYLETFGVYAHLPPGYEDEFCRPPIDSSHARWKKLYPKRPTHRLTDGRPYRERFGANATSELSVSAAAQDPDALLRDELVIGTPASGWPALERLKALSRLSTSTFGQGYAWGQDVDKTPFLPPPPAPPGGAEPAPAAAAGARPSSRGTTKSAGGGKKGGGAKKGGKDGGKDGGEVPLKPLPPNPVPFSVAIETIRQEEAVKAQLEDDKFDSVLDASHLREWVEPDQLEAWASGREVDWGKQRGGSLLALRYRDLTHLLSTLHAAAPHIHTLHLNAFPSHFNLNQLLPSLPSLTSLTLTYGNGGAGLRFEPSQFGMRLEDAEGLGRFLGSAACKLTSLALPRNRMSDAVLEALVQAGLIDNRTLTSLDLSANELGPEGAVTVGRLLTAPRLPLIHLNLNDNPGLGAEGAAAIGEALETHCKMTITPPAAAVGAGAGTGAKPGSASGMRPGLGGASGAGKAPGAAASKLGALSKLTGKAGAAGAADAKAAETVVPPLALPIKVGPRLVSLSLAMCELGDEGASVLIHHAAGVTTIKTLNLANNKLGRMAADAIGELLSGTALAALAVAGGAGAEPPRPDTAGQSGPPAPGTAVAVPPATCVLEKLDLSGNLFSHSDAETIAAAARGPDPRGLGLAAAAASATAGLTGRGGADAASLGLDRHAVTHVRRCSHLTMVSLRGNPGLSLSAEPVVDLDLTCRENALALKRGGLSAAIAETAIATGNRLAGLEQVAVPLDTAPQ